MTNLDSTYAPDDRSHAFENHGTGYLISLAGPGTGKTYSLLKRTETLTTQGLSQESICYLTFIKEISKAFAQDYIEKFGTESYEAHKPRISTLHSFACQLLRNQGFRIGYDGELFFTNTADNDSDAASTYLTDLLPFTVGPNCSTPAQLRRYLKSIKAAWRDTVDPASLADPIPAILHHAERLSQAFRLIDWDQTIPLSHSLAIDLGTMPDWVLNIEHYFVDEYQDFNRAEQSLISFLTAVATSVVIVGDDDQSLYSGRGGSPDGLRNLFSDTAYDQISLIKNFRCRENIVAAANALQRAMHANPRIMVSAKGGGQIHAYRFKSSKAELEYLAKYLQDCVANAPQASSSKDGTVCLFPNWKTLDSYLERLAAQVPCIKRKTNPDPNRLWLERVLYLAITPNQRFVERLLLNEYKQIMPRHKRMLVVRILERDISVVAALQSLIADGSLFGNAAAQSHEACQLLEDLSSRNAARTAQHIATKLGKDLPTTEFHLEGLLEKSDELEKEELLATYCDLILPDSALPAEDPRAILFLTMHGAKGLTKKNIVIPGLEAAWLPGTSTGAELEEKRRLFYVAITRATDSVLITFPQNRSRKDSLNYLTPGRGEPSPFIAEAGLKDVYHS